MDVKQGFYSSSAAYALRKIRRFTYSIMSYGILQWGRAADGLPENIFSVQKSHQSHIQPM